jgi:uncharacterized protein (TIGR02996 family)
VTDGDALLQAILAHPGDELVRLVYADWLEEAGETERAELIRLQIELVHADTALPRARAREQVLLGPGGAQVWQRRREWALTGAARTTWPGDVGGWEWHRGFPEVWHAPLKLWLAHGPELVTRVPVRQVVVIDREPRRSRTDPRKPERTWLRDEASWIARPAPECLLPPEVFDFLEPDPLDFAMFSHTRVYPSRADAVAALSSACLLFAMGVAAV